MYRSFPLEEVIPKGLIWNIVSKTMRSILGMEYEYVRVYVYSIVLQAVIGRRTEKASASETNLKVEDQQDSDVLYDRLYLGYLTDAARSLLSIVVDELFSEGYLRCNPRPTIF